MKRKLNLAYASIICYNGRARMDFGVYNKEGLVKVRRVTGPTTRFSNIVVDINERLLFGRGKVCLHAQGWTFYPSGPRRRV